MAESGLRGTTAAQDTRFKDKEAAAVKATSFPPHFSEKVDLRKVNVSVLKSWIAQKVTDMIRVEDDVVVEYVIGMLEDKEKPMPDPKKMQVSLLGFMDKYGAAAFMDQLWALLLSAQKTVGGVPAEFIAAKKAELERQQMYARTDNKYAARENQNQNRASAEDSFGGGLRRSDERGLPSRPDDRGGRGGGGGGYGRSSPQRDRDRDRDRNDNYGQRRGGGGGGGPRRFDDRPRDTGYGQRRRSPSPGYRRRSPSPPPRRRSPPPGRRDSPPPRRRSPPPRRRSPSPARERERSITPPLRTRRDSPRAPPPRRSPSDSPPPREQPRGRSRSRTPTPHDSRDSRSRSRSRSPTVTPPRRRNDSTPPRERTRRRSSTPPRNRRDSTPRSSPQLKRKRDEEDDEVVKKGRGRFSQEDEEARREAEPAKKKLDGPLAKSKWA